MKIKEIKFKNGQKINLPFDVELPDDYELFDNDSLINYIFALVIEKLGERLAVAEKRLEELS